MPRRSRIIIAGVPVHIIQRGNNRQACFFAREDYLYYLKWLKEYALESNCTVHAYVLMTNHVHLLLTPTEESSAATLMKRLGQRYVQYINRTYRRSGTLWEGRFRSCVASQDRYLFICHRYIELNPVRAGLVSLPGEYLWTSYRANAQGEENSIITNHPLYLVVSNFFRTFSFQSGPFFYIFLFLFNFRSSSAKGQNARLRVKRAPIGLDLAFWHC